MSLHLQEYEKGKECYLYWIHKENHKDIYSEGYVGITINPETRFRNHTSNLNRKVNTYSKYFIHSYFKHNLYMDIIHVGSKEEIIKLEYQYRPLMNIGYNVAIGGADTGLSLRYKHGGTKDYSEYKRFKKLLNRCIKDKLTIDPQFLLEDGFNSFLNTTKDMITYTSYYYSLIDEEKGFVLNNYIRTPFKINSDNQSFVLYEGKELSKKEALFYTSIALKTIEKRISKYGWTNEQAFGFEAPPHNQYQIVTIDNIDFKLDNKSKYSEDDLRKLYHIFTTDYSQFHTLCKELKIEYRNILRFFKRYNVSFNFKGNIHDLYKRT